MLTRKCHIKIIPSNKLHPQGPVGCIHFKFCIVIYFKIKFRFTTDLMNFYLSIDLNVWHMLRCNTTFDQTRPVDTKVSKFKNILNILLLELQSQLPTIFYGIVKVVYVVMTQNKHLEVGRSCCALCVDDDAHVGWVSI